MNNQIRRYDIDCIRVIAFVLLIVYHVGMFFTPWGWHVKNNVLYPKLEYPMLFLNQWRLPLLFVISGMGTYFALGKRSGKQYLSERLKRLLLPFIIGVLVVVPPQVYIEKIDLGLNYGGYFGFWPAHFFDGVYPEGNFSWHHLWFILYLFVYSVLFLPLFLYIKRRKDNWFSKKMTWLVSSATGLIVLSLPLFVWKILLADKYPSTNAFFGDWFNLLYYATFFVLGFMLIDAKDRFWKSIETFRNTFLCMGVLSFSLLMYLWFGGLQDSLLLNVARKMVQTLNVWGWILTIIGFAAFYLNKPSKRLTYANEAVYPFYILHQTIIVVLGYYMRDWDMGFFVKFPILIILTFSISWVIYEFAIRRFKLIRPFFGLKNKR